MELPFDETGLPGECLPQYGQIRDWLDNTPRDVLLRKRREAELLFRRIGITFSVYSEGGDPERLIPFDIIPRVLHPDEWKFLSRGLTQRVKALNAFAADIYHARDILRAGMVPSSALRCRALRRRTASIPTSPVSTWCGSARRISTYSRIIAARRRASPTCWRTARR
jgi:uncharacterized circularly permuted ATP-grasp superfamily protein